LIFSVILLRDLGAIDEMKYFVHFLITIIALMIAVILLPGMYIQGTNALIAFALMALILGLVNVFLRPLMTIISLGCIVFTLGFFLLVINVGSRLDLLELVAYWILYRRLLDGFRGFINCELCIIHFFFGVSESIIKLEMPSPPNLSS
jgi:putative membrane protein